MKQPEDNKTVDLVDAAAAPSTRGRKAMAAAEVVDVQIDTAALQRDNQAASAIAVRQGVISQTYGDNLVYQRERVVNEAQFFIGQSGEALLQAGKRMVELKENESHGDFLAIVENQLGLGKRAAQAMMQAAAKYLSPRLVGKAQTSALLGRSKMLELVTEPDEDLEQFFDGGTLAGHTFAEVDAMSVRELRAALRDRDLQIEAKDKVLADRNAKVDRLEQRLHRPYKPSKEAAARTAAEKLMLDDLQAATIEANGGMNKIVEVMTDMAGADVSESCRLAAHNDLIWLAQRLAEVMKAHAIQFDLEEAVVPSWVREHAGKLKAVQS